MKKISRSHLKSYFRVLALAFIGVFVFLAPASAITVYSGATAEADFYAHLTDYYLEEFNTDNGEVNYVDYSGSGYSWHGEGWAVGAPGRSEYGLWDGTNGYLRIHNANDYIKIDFTGAPVEAVGGIFDAYALYGQPYTVIVSINDGSSIEVESFGGGFLGFTTDWGLYFTGLTIATIPTENDEAYARLDHFYVGNSDVVPEPTTMLLLGAGLLGVAGTVRRRKG